MDSRESGLLNTFICKFLTDCLGDELKEIRKSEWFWEKVNELIPNNNIEEVINHIEKIEWKLQGKYLENN